MEKPNARGAVCLVSEESGRNPRSVLVLLLGAVVGVNDLGPIGKGVFVLPRAGLAVMMGDAALGVLVLVG